MKHLRTRKFNIVTGVRLCAKNAKTPFECWNLFFCNNILEIIVQNTNKMIQMQRSNFSRQRDAKETDKIEIKALLGLLYLAGTPRSSHLNVDDLWERDGTGVEKFWLTMSKERFLFLLRYLRYDDKQTRDERKA